MGDCIFAVSAERGVEKVLRALRKNFRLAEKVGSDEDIFYYDTFDWRLYRSGGTLSWMSRPKGAQLRWQRFGDVDGDSLEIGDGLEIEAVPPFVQAFPAGALREGLAAIVEMRRLLPVAVLRRKAIRLRVP